jgi:streptogramin lyase
MVAVMTVLLPVSGVLTGAGPAKADYAPIDGGFFGDVVGLSGVPGLGTDFADDGDQLGDTGYNAAGDLYKAITFDPTADVNGRTAYSNGSTLSAPLPLDPTVVLAGGTYPVQRPAGSNAAISALLSDTSPGDPYIDFVVSLNPATTAQNATAQANGWLGLVTVQIATDTLGIAVDSAGTNAPAGLSVDELNGIYSGYYQTWNQLPGNSAGSADAIIPELPPRGTPFYSQFLSDIGNPSLASDVQTVNADDPSAIAGASDPADAIMPFSAALASLYASGYFPDPAAPYPGAPDNPGIQLLTAGATAPDGDLTYQGIHGIYVIFRQSDAESSRPWQPGGTQNWVNTLFLANGVTTPYYATAAAQANLTAAGLTASYYVMGSANPDPDKIGTQPPLTPANLNDVIVATGDSVTSAQNQFVSGIPGNLGIPGVPANAPVCPNISADQRGLTGDDGRFSYAGRYFRMSLTAVEYWNFARTGYGTGDMLDPTPGADACGNAWTGDAAAGGVKSPADSAAAVISAAHAKGYNTYYVTTGGVNNTNWTSVLGSLAICRAWANASTMLGPYGLGAVTATVTWNAAGGEQGIFPAGGTCTLTVAYPGGTATWTQKVPAYNGLAGIPCSQPPPGGPELACINADATTIVNKELAAGADKVVWMQYYDMTLANVDVGDLLWAYLRSVGYFAGVLPAQPPRYLVPLLDPLWQPAAKSFINQLNVAIFNGINSAGSPKVKMGYPGIVDSTNIQATGIGGSPHPNSAGQLNMALLLRKVLSQLPLPAKPARGAITEYSLPPGSQPTYIAYGGDGNLWVSEPNSGRLGVVSVNGNSVQLFLQRPNIINGATGRQTLNFTGPAGLVTGPDGNIWLAENGASVLAKISPAGAVTEIPLIAKGSGPTGIVSNGASLWVTETNANQVARVVAATGAVTEFPLPAASRPAGLTSDANGNLWVTEPGTNQVAEVNPANGAVIAQVNLPAGAAPNAIALGSDGNLWVTEPGLSKVAVINPGGAPPAVTAQVALPAGANPAGIASALDGNIWVTEPGINKVVRIVTATMAPTQYTMPTANSAPTGISTGSDGNLWITEANADQVATIAP